LIHATLLLAAGCAGVIDSPLAPSAPTGPAAAAQPPSPTPAAPAPPPAKVRTERAFTPSADRLALLPFEVRLNRLSAVTGAPTTDAIFADLRARRLDLGAHDFGANVAPDLTWSAQRMGTWVQGLFKVCDDSRVKARYPSWSSGLDTFAQAAWGRTATDEDRQLLAEATSEAGASGEDAWRAGCLTLLSSAELVTQ
jgi:hypothetical protein